MLCVCLMYQTLGGPRLKQRCWAALTHQRLPFCQSLRGERLTILLSSETQVNVGAERLLHGWWVLFREKSTTKRQILLTLVKRKLKMSCLHFNVVYNNFFSATPPKHPVLARNITHFRLVQQIFLQSVLEYPWDIIHVTQLCVLDY